MNVNELIATYTRCSRIQEDEIKECEPASFGEGYAKGKQRAYKRVLQDLEQLSTIEYSHAIPLTTHEKITAELFDTYKRKNHDYGDSFTESLNEFGLVAGLVRVGDKVNRLKSLTKNEQRVNDESLRDTILDASNYLIMMAMWIDNK